MAPIISRDTDHPDDDDKVDTRRQSAPRRVICRSSAQWLFFVASCARLLLYGGALKSNGVLLDDLVDLLDTSHSMVAWAFALQNGLANLLAPVIQVLLTYFSHRKLWVVGGALAGAGYIYAGLFTTSVIHLFIGYVITGVGFCLVNVPAYLAILVAFGEEFAVVVSSSGLFTFVGMALLPPLMKRFQTTYGSRGALILFGALMFNLTACGVATRLPPKRINPICNGRERNDEQTPNRGMKEKDEDVRRNEHLNVVNDSPSRSATRTKQSHPFARYLPFCSPLFAHKNFAVLSVFSITTCYVLTSWVIFLVSFGKDAGLTPESAVFLSTTGGIGGLLGESFCTVLFYLDKKGPFLCCFPNLLSGLFLLFCTLSSNVVVLNALTFLCGFFQGMSVSVLYGSIPLTVCDHHFPQAASLLFFAEGVMIQFSGLISGVIYDVSGSAKVVFASSALICFLVAPLMFVWDNDDDRETKDCRIRLHRDHNPSYI